ncbi:PhoH family protein [Candidatus Woesearchaeota archaeon]|nr:PhoH family protein [Candidatus Woesearchaeota archaeon]
MSKLKYNGNRAPIYSNLVLLKSDNAAGGREVGFLPGSLFDKIVDDLKPFEDAHKILHFYRDFEFGDLIYHQNRELPRIGGPRSAAAAKAEYDNGKLPIGPALEVTHFSKFRGRSFENTFLVVDEAQNFTPQEMQVIITRMGTGSKVVVLGDPNKQIDNVDCTRNYNGIVQPVEEFLDKPYSMLINLGSKYRSEMAKDGDDWNV